MYFGITHIYKHHNLCYNLEYKYAVVVEGVSCELSSAELCACVIPCVEQSNSLALQCVTRAGSQPVEGTSGNVTVHALISTLNILSNYQLNQD